MARAATTADAFNAVAVVVGGGKKALRARSGYGSSCWTSAGSAAAWSTSATAS